MFLLDSVSPTHFFKKGLPCDIGIMSAVCHYKPNVYDNCCFMAKALVNLNFDKKKVIKENFFKWYPPTIPRVVRANLRYLSLSRFPGIAMNHLPQIYLKKTFEEIWKYCENDLSRTCASKFRSYGDVSPTLIRYWQLVSGNFTPCDVFKYGSVFYLCDRNISESVDCICHQSKKIVCLNDGEHVTHFEDYKKRLLDAFEQILPDKCGFEL
jgi:hypothetical protein